LLDNATYTYLGYKDPWVIDSTDAAYYDSPRGYRNLGESAIFKSEPSPLQPNLSNKYKGVFLGQQAIPDNAYYSFRIPLTINGIPYNVLSWQYDPNKVDLIDEPEAGFARKAVVFKLSGASVTAKMKAYLASGTSAATANNNQRKIASNTIGTSTVHHMVYESGGDVWYTTSTNGAAWTPEVIVSDGSGI
jgi:hypothetical protein